MEDYSEYEKAIIELSKNGKLNIKELSEYMAAAFEYSETIKRICLDHVEDIENTTFLFKL